MIQIDVGLLLGICSLMMGAMLFVLMLCLCAFMIMSFRRIETRQWEPNIAFVDGRSRLLSRIEAFVDERGRVQMVGKRTLGSEFAGFHVMAYIVTEEERE